MDVPGRQDVQDGEPGDSARVVQDQPVRDAGTAVVAGQLELAEADISDDIRVPRQLWLSSRAPLNGLVKASSDGPDPDGAPR
jgi:hypothetical protein